MFPVRDDVASNRYPLVTNALILISGIVLLYQYLAPDILLIYEQWALIPANVDFSDFYTLLPFISAIFLHGGLWHYFSNMWFLHIFGDNVEARLGSMSYLIFYLTGGVAAGLLQYVLAPHDSLPIVGASGAIAAVLGFYFIQFPHHKVQTLVPGILLFFTIKLPARLVLFLWFGLQLLNGISTFGGDTSIAWWAHVGGFVFGMLAGLFIRTGEPLRFSYS